MPLGVRFWVLLLTAAAVTSTLLLFEPGSAVGVLRPLPLAVAAGVGIAEIYSLWESGRPRNISLTVSELFVGIALVVLPGEVAILALAAGSTSAVLARSGIGAIRGVPVRSPWVLLHGVALPVLRGAAAIATTTAAAGWLGTVGAAMAGIVVLVLVDLALAPVVVRLETGMSLREVVGDIAAAEIVVPLVAGGFGVLLGDAIRQHPRAWVLVLCTAGLVAAVSHGGTRWARERLRSRVLLEGALATGSQTTAEDVIRELVAQASAALHVQRVEVTAEEPSWAEMVASLGAHGWIGVADRTIRTQAAFDHRDSEVLVALAAVATVSLDNAVLVERLEAEQRMREALFASAAHDLRSPLAITGGALQTLREREGLEAADETWLLDAAERSASRASRLVQDLVAFERQELQPGASDGAADPVAAVHDHVAGLPRDTGTRVRVHADEPVPDVAMSPVLFERVLDNLVGNALKHTPEEEDVDVRVHVASDATAVTIAVEDRGPGVPPAERARILAPFARSTTSAAGHGLGLHIVTQFVQRASGDLVIADRPDGPGASFQVRLPAVARPTAGPEGAAGPPSVSVAGPGD